MTQQIKLDTAQFGNTGMEITRIGFGAWAIGGGDWAFGWGDQDDQDAVQAIQHAVDSGINWIDTAAVYGFGRSEKTVGEALKGIDPDKRPYVFTKCSMRPGPDGHTPLHSLSRDSVLQECEESLQRLGTDAIDLYQIHWPNPEPDIEEGWKALAELKEQGQVKHIGVSNFDVEQLERIRGIAPVETLQPPYSLVSRGVEPEILPYCKQQGIGVIAYSPMGSGLLSGKMTRERIQNFPDNDWRKHSDQFNEPRLSENLEIVERLKRIAERYSTTAGTVAVAWTLANPAVSAAIVGFRNPGQVDPILPAANLRLTDDDVAEIEGR